MEHQDFTTQCKFFTFLNTNFLKLFAMPWIKTYTTDALFLFRFYQLSEEMEKKTNKKVANYELGNE